MKSFRVFLWLAGAVVVLTTFASDTPSPGAKPDVWEPLRFLIGKWEGDISGESGAGKAEREYGFTLNNRFIHVANRSIYPPQEKNKQGETHEDIGFFSYDQAAKKFALRQFHGEGFVNHYVLDSIADDGRTIVFVTTAIENIATGWRGRETYRLVSDGEFIETFALAAPGKEFETYSETRFRRRR